MNETAFDIYIDLRQHPQQHRIPSNIGISPLEGNGEIATQMRRIAFAVLWNYLFAVSRTMKSCNATRKNWKQFPE